VYPETHELHMVDPTVELYVHEMQLDGHSEHTNNKTSELGLPTSDDRLHKTSLIFCPGITPKRGVAGTSHTTTEIPIRMTRL